MSSSILSLMRKGVSALQNIQLLKWYAQYGILAHWNYLYGFPGESAEHYEGQAELLAKLKHLTPPVGYAPVRFDRFSPYSNNPASSDFPTCVRIQPISTSIQASPMRT